MNNVKADPRATFKGLDDRIKEMPGMNDLLDFIEQKTRTGSDEAGDNGHFNLPYSSDPQPIEKPWN